MKSTLKTIEEIKNNGYKLDFSTVFNFAFENYKKIVLYASILLIVFSILVFFIGSGLFVSIFGINNYNQDFFSNLQDEKFLRENLLWYTVVISILSATLSPLTAGFLKMADCAQQNKEFKVSTLFSYYKPNYLAPLFIATFAISATEGAISIACNAAGIQFIDTAISLCISLYTSMTIPLIIFGKLGIVDALKSSCIVVSKQPMAIALLFIVGGIFSAAGFMFFIIGIVFTIPFSYALKYAIYKSILKPKNQDQTEFTSLTD